MKRTLPLLLITVLAVGCQNGSTPVAKAPENSSQATPSGKPSPSAAETKAPTLAELPAELKHAAFDYYGLANEKPVNMQAVYSSQPQVITGTQTVRLKEMRDGNAIFMIERTGGLAQLGDQEMSLEKDGLYVTQSTIAKVNHDLELPADVTPGKMWDNKTEVEGQISLNSKFKVVGVQKVKTKVGDRDALFVTSTGEGTMRGQKVKVTSENWFVKGVGGVKSVLKIAFPGGKTETVTVEETK